ncbi:MAG: AraC family transcriptional regulator [Clostridia bacterium]|nr:AraC family transcriptional regulator [Clostridia bacterium]
MQTLYTEEILKQPEYILKKGFKANGKYDFMCMIPNTPENEYLNVQMLGFEECTSTKQERKHTFEANTLHFIISGKGSFDGIQIGANDCFIIKKGHLAEYFPDNNDPWTYCWINFDGAMADRLLATAGLPENRCTFSLNNVQHIFKIIKSALYADYQSTDVAMHLNSVLLEIFALILKFNPDSYAYKAVSLSETRVSRSLEFIKQHYKEKNCIDLLAQNEKVNKRYLSRLFKEHSELSPQGHLIKLRIDEAQRLLRTSHISISSAGESVGYEDVMQFSKIFKKHTGMSPTQYRKLKFNVPY